MKFYLPFALLLFVSPVFAQETITIIQEDGSVDVIDMGGGVPAPEPVETAPPPEPEQETTPAPEPAAKAAVKAKKDPKAVPKPTPKSAPKSAPKPGVKKTVVKPVPKPLFQTIPEGAEITRERALYIALEAAPPAFRSEVFESRFEGAPAFSVLFKTEDGDYEVTVDRVKGHILQSGYLVKDSVHVLPGHLPRP